MKVTLIYRNPNDGTTELLDIDEVHPMREAGVYGMYGPPEDGLANAVVYYNPDALAAVVLEREDDSLDEDDDAEDDEEAVN